MRRLVAAALVTLTVAACASAFLRAAARATDGPAAVSPPGPVRPGLPGEGLQTTQVRRYTMSGRVRPLLFWIGRDDIGLAQIVWRSGDSGRRAYELLVGTDPLKAPRALNRWGFISEEVRGVDASMLALMTGSNETSYDDEAARPTSGNDLRAIRSTVHDGHTAWQTARIEASSGLSVHDLDAALTRVQRDTASAATRRAPMPAGARPGFLVALADLVDLGAARPPADAAARRARETRIEYVFGQGRYDLGLRDASPSRLVLHGRSVPVVRSSFEIRTLSTDDRTRFEVVFGADGALAGVPLAAKWQPRWWLEVELRLLDPA
jgi:hypothetical protein